MNPIDPHWRRNQLSGSTAAPSCNALTRLAKPSRNQIATPTRKLGLVWNMVTTGMPLIEQMIAERSFTEYDVYDRLAGSLGHLPREATQLADLYANIINNDVDGWVSSVGGVSEANRIKAAVCDFIRGIGDSTFAAWLSSLDVQADDGDAQQWLLGPGGKSFELAVAGILREYANA